MKNKLRKIAAYAAGMMPKNNTSKMAAVFLILSAGVFGSYLVVSSLAGSGPAAGSNVSVGNLNQLQGDKGGVFAENSGQSPDSVDGQINSASQNNLTQILGNSFFNQVQAADINNQGPADLKKISGVMSDGVFSDIAKASPKFKTEDDIEVSSLNIIADNSSEAKILYWKNVKETLKKDFPVADNQDISKVIKIVYGSLDSSPAVKLAGIYKKLTNDFMKLSIPSSMTDLHRQILAFYQNSETVYESMASYPQDPVKGYFALEMAEQLEAEAKQLQNTINKY